MVWIIYEIPMKSKNRNLNSQLNEVSLNQNLIAISAL